MIDPCRVSIEELRHDESQIDYDDSPVDYHYPVLEDGIYWIKDLNDVLVCIENHELSREAMIELGEYAFTPEQARQIGELLIRLSEC